MPKGLMLLAVRKWLRTWWKWLAGGLGLALGGFLLVSWLLFQHVPSWYQPVAVPLDRVSEVQSDLARTADKLNERMMLADAPFEFRITQDQVNAWLAAREEMWPLSREWLPPGITEPFISIEPEGVRLAGTLQYGSIQTVVSLKLALEVIENQVRVRLLEVTSGSLPIPASLVEQQVVSFERRYADRLHKDISLKGLTTDGISFSNRGVWRHLDQQPKTYELIGLSLESGALTATLQTLPRRQPVR